MPFCHVYSGISAELSCSFDYCSWWARRIRREMALCTCKISRWRIDSKMDRCTPSSILRTRSNLRANMADGWLRVQLVWVTLPLLQCTIIHLCSMQDSLWARLVADPCHISRWCKGMGAMGRRRIRRVTLWMLIVLVHENLSFCHNRMCEIFIFCWKCWGGVRMI